MHRNFLVLYMNEARFAICMEEIMLESYQLQKVCDLRRKNLTKTTIPKQALSHHHDVHSLHPYVLYCVEPTWKCMVLVMIENKPVDLSVPYFMVPHSVVSSEKSQFFFMVRFILMWSDLMWYKDSISTHIHRIFYGSILYICIPIIWVEKKNKQIFN